MLIFFKLDGRMSKIWPFQWKLTATITYIISIVVLNGLFINLPMFHAFGESLSPADALVGVIYIFRDFSQREIRHYILLAMLVGCLISFLLAKPIIALASVGGFATGELVDWLIFSFTKKPLSQRLLLSAMISSPIDSYVFLALANALNWVGWTVMNLGKFSGVLAIWLLWKYRKSSSHLSSQGMY